MSSKELRNRLSKKINSLSFDKEELKKLLGILQERANKAAEIECTKVESMPNIENIELVKSDLKKCAELKITITGINGEELFGTIDEVFNSIHFPELIKSLYVNSDLQYRIPHKYIPENSFQLQIDFSKPKVFDFSLQPSESTPNDSEFEVQGSDNTWVNGVFHEIDVYIQNKPSKFPSVHKGGIYDLLVWFLGIPFGFWVCYRFSFFTEQVFKNHSFLGNVFFTYCFFLSLFFLRILFQYFRWVYPMIEYRSSKGRSTIHQLILGGISIGLVTSFLYDMFRLLLNFKA